MRRSKSLGFTSAVAAAAILALASIAWACTVQSSISVTSSGAASLREASVVRVFGSGFKPSAVEIRWNDDSGALLGTAEGPEFSTAITIPADTPAGLYYLVAIQKAPGARPDDVHAVAKAAQVLEVFPSAGSKALSSATVSKDLWSGFESAGDGQALSTQEAANGMSPAIGPSAGLVGGALLLAAGAVASCWTVLVHARRRRPYSSRH